MPKFHENGHSQDWQSINFLYISVADRVNSGSLFQTRSLECSCAESIQ